MMHEISFISVCAVDDKYVDKCVKNVVCFSGII